MKPLKQKMNESLNESKSQRYTSMKVLTMSKKAGEIVIDAEYALRDLIIAYGDSIPKESVIKILTEYDLTLGDVR